MSKIVQKGICKQLEQQDIINAFCELVGMINDKEFFVNSFNVKSIESDLDEIISMDFDE